VRLAVDRPELVSRLVLCWPATAGDEWVDERAGVRIRRHRPDHDVDLLLGGGTLRGVADAEIDSLRAFTLIVPTDPPDRVHQARTVAALAARIPHSAITAAFPHTLHVNFPPVCTDFVALLQSAAAGEPG
jgi:hypothetical protein